MGELPTPRARRLATPRWLDARLVAGVLLVLVSVAAGAKVFASADDAATVWVTRHALAPGEHLTTADLRQGRARLYGRADAYVSADRPLPEGYVVLRRVGAGELLPYAALADAAAAPQPTRLVTVPVQPGHLPPGLAAGDQVDVYATAKADPGEVAQPRLVLEAAAVQEADGGSSGLTAAGSTRSVVLSVPVDGVADLVGAVESGSVDLVRVPPRLAGTARAGTAAPSARSAAPTPAGSAAATPARSAAPTPTPSAGSRQR